MNEADADEAWNTAFLAVLDQARSITPIGVGLRQFALGVVFRKGIDAVRRAKGRMEVPIDEHYPNTSGRGSPVDAAKVQRIHDCLAAARPSYAAVMEMTAQGLTAAEIALIMGKSDGSIDKLRLGRGPGSPIA